LADGEALLRRCFAAVFPDLPDGEIEQASVDTVAEWDSLASVTLLALLEEEFGIQVSELDLPDLRSFTAVRDYLRCVHALAGDESTATAGEG
jgi:acyl carrier protein